MSVWLTPDLKPFYGGTYFPPTSRVGQARVSSTSCEEIARVWQRGARQGRAVGRERDRAAASVDGQRRAGGRVPGADALDRTVDAVRAGVRSRATAASATRRSFRGRASCCSCCASTRGPATPTPRDMVLRDAAGDGARRHARPHRRRVPPLLGRRRLARAALREDALRPGAARARVRSRRRRSPAIAFFAEVADDTLRVRPARDDRPGRRLLFGRGCRQRAARTRRPIRMPHKMEGAFYLWTRRRARRRCSATTPTSSSQRFGIEPDGNAPFDPQQEFTGKNLLYVGAIDRRRRASDRAIGATRSTRSLQRARACAVRGAARRGRGRTSTTRC